jgi:YD repeat-containing protein
MGSYSYAGTGFANPHAVTQIGNGVSTTTYTYDYANRLTAIFSLGATTSYGYDAFGARVYQIIATTSTSTYPFKFFSIASTTKSSNNYAISTEYVFNGDTLLFTLDQPFKNGAATGTARLGYGRRCGIGNDHRYMTTDQIGRERRQSIVLALSPSVFDSHVLALDKAAFLQPLAECGHEERRWGKRRAPEKPITGIAGCCASAASGHPTTAPPSSVMNARRLV